MAYIICNNDNYLLQESEGFQIVNNYKEASVWKNLAKANNVAKNINQNAKMKKYHLSVKFITRSNGEVGKPAVSIELDYDIAEKIKEISLFSKQLEERQLYLAEKISRTEAELVDIEHAAEFYNLNASQGYKLYKLLHDTRIERRKYKDELEKIKLSLGTSFRSSNMENLERSIMGLDYRKYTPRVNKELFGV